MQIAVLVPVLLTFSSSVFATCWFPDGQESTLDTACNPDAIVSACCYDRQACLSNGLCVSDPHDPAKSRTHRGTCTDRGWKSGNCVRQCFDNMHAGAPVYSCNITDVDSYCCYDNCKCENPFEVFTFPDPPSAINTVTIILEKFTANATRPSATSRPPARPPTVPASASVSPTDSSTGSIAGTSTSDTNGGSQNYLALGIGLGLGLGLGIPLIFVAAFCIWRRKLVGDKPANNTANPPVGPNEGYYPPQPKNESLHEVPRSPEPAPATEILPGEKDMVMRHLVELPDRQSRTAAAPATHSDSEKQL